VRGNLKARNNPGYRTQVAWNNTMVFTDLNVGLITKRFSPPPARQLFLLLGFQPELICHSA
jgi:hypothetical protein